MNKMEYCKKCKTNVTPVIVEQTFSNKKVHLRGECPLCEKFIRFVPWAMYRPGENPNDDSTKEHDRETWEGEKAFWRDIEAQANEKLQG